MMPLQVDMTGATELANNLRERLEKTKVYVGTKQTQYEYKHRECLSEIWAIDDFVNAAYGLTEAESNILRILLLGTGQVEELTQMKIIDLFAGCGGLSLGFIQAGFSVEKAVEYDPVIANTYQRNHPEVDVIVDDIKNIDTSDMFAGTTADVIIGGPPCQGFSMAGARIRQGFIDDPRNYLFKHYFNVVKTVRPKVFVMENVKAYLLCRGEI